MGSSRPKTTNELKGAACTLKTLVGLAGFFGSNRPLVHRYRVLIRYSGDGSAVVTATTELSPPVFPAGLLLP
eukprot:4498280-Heterocapsa_arctica.AAC.1